MKRLFLASVASALAIGFAAAQQTGPMPGMDMKPGAETKPGMGMGMMPGMGMQTKPGMGMHGMDMKPDMGVDTKPGMGMPGMGMETKPGMDMKSGMDTKMAPNPSESVSTKGYQAAMMKMMEGMPMTKYTGDADIDFMSQMRAHHQGAIDMAKIVLVNGKDTEVKKLALDIITAQEKEIATINAWLKAK